jgi:hypothetical protein
MNGIILCHYKGCNWVLINTIFSNMLFHIILSYLCPLLCALAKLRKTSSCLSAIPLICQHGTRGLSLNGFSWNLIFEYFPKSVENTQISLNSDKYNECLIQGGSNMTGTDLCVNKPHKSRSYLNHLVWQPIYIAEWKMFQTKTVEKIKTHILCSITIFRNFCRLWDNM